MQDGTVTSISEIKFDFTPVESAKSKRNALLKELYSLYISQPEINRKENRKRYHEYMREKHPEFVKKAGFNKAKYDSFKDEFRKAKLPKEKKCVSYITEERFWPRFTHLKGEEGTRALNHMISVSRDKLHRGELVAKYILGSVKYVDKSLAENTVSGIM